MTSRALFVGVVCMLAVSSVGTAALLDASASRHAPHARAVAATATQSPSASAPQTSAPSTRQEPGAPAERRDGRPDEAVDAQTWEHALEVLEDLDLDELLADVERTVEAAVDEVHIEEEVTRALEDVDIDGIVAQAMRSVDDLLPRTPRLGVGVRDLTADEAKTAGLAGIAGAWVTAVQPDTPAAEAGLAAGDVIVEVDGQPVRGARHLTRLVSETPEGRMLPIVYVRGGQRTTVTVTPAPGRVALRAPRGEAVPRAFTFATPGRAFTPLLSRGRLGIGIQDLTPQLATYFGVEGGVLVTTVADDSAASRAGMRAGDVVTRVGATDIANTRDLAGALAAVERGASVEIEISRERATTTLTVTPETAPTRQRMVVRPRTRTAA